MLARTSCNNILTYTSIVIIIFFFFFTFSS